jgi:hypothetical protein
MADMTLSLGASVLKYLDAKQKDVIDMCMRKSPTLALLPQLTDHGGEGRRVPIITGRPVGGRSRTFATAQTNAGTASTQRFVVTTTSNYGVATIERKAVLGSKGDNAAVIDLLDLQISGITDSLSDDICTNLFRGTGGARGQVGAYTATATTLTLLNIEDAVHFEKGMVIVADTVDGTGTVNSGSATIAAVDYDTGVLTASAAWDAGIASIAVNDYLFASGDYGVGAAGLAAWIPSSAPGATAFFGVDRSVSPTRLGGIRPSTSVLTGTISERLRRSAAVCKRHGATPTLIVMNPMDVADLDIELGDKVRYMEVESPESNPVQIGFEAIAFATPIGKLPVVGDPYCQPGVAWMLDAESWCTDSMGQLIQIVDEDTKSKMLRQSAADGFEIRIASYYNHFTNAPGHNARVSLT